MVCNSTTAEHQSLHIAHSPTLPFAALWHRCYHILLQVSAASGQHHHNKTQQDGLASTPLACHGAEASIFEPNSVERLVGSGPFSLAIFQIRCSDWTANDAYSSQVPILNRVELVIPRGWGSVLKIRCVKMPKTSKLANTAVHMREFTALLFQNSKLELPSSNRTFTVEDTFGMPSFFLASSALRDQNLICRKSEIFQHRRLRKYYRWNYLFSFFVRLLHPFPFEDLSLPKKCLQIIEHILTFTNKKIRLWASRQKCSWNSNAKLL